MGNQENLVEIMSNLGRPPNGVDIETFAIAKVDPADLTAAAKRVTPSYEQLRRINNENPDLYKYITEEPQPEKSLGEGVLLKQQRLSRTRRVTATGLTALTLASGMGALTYSAKNDIRKDYPSIAKKDPNKKEQLTTSAAAGGIVGMAGGFIVHISGFFFTHRLARKPARRIVRQVEQQSV